MKVYINKNRLNTFRKKSRKTNLEIQALLFGSEGSDGYTVKKIVYPKQYGTQTVNFVQWYKEEWDQAVELAKEEGLIFLGDIHSHPKVLPVLSKDDYNTHLLYQQKISGICSVLGNRTYVLFWAADSALPLKIVYV